MKELLTGACHFFSNVPVPEHAEFLACRRGVQLATELGIKNMYIETNNYGVAQVLHFGDRDRSRFGPLIEEIKELLKGVDEHLVICMKKLCKIWFNLP